MEMAIDEIKKFINEKGLRLMEYRYFKNSGNHLFKIRDLNWDVHSIFLKEPNLEEFKVMLNLKNVKMKE
jgi:hypothetical protein